MKASVAFKPEEKSAATCVKICMEENDRWQGIKWKTNNMIEQERLTYLHLQVF